MKTAIINAKIVTAENVIDNGVCIIDNERISYVGTENSFSDNVIDADSRYLIPGFVDLHCHGGNGFDFMDATEKACEEIANFHLRHGTTTMLATTLTASDEETEKALKTIDVYKQKKPLSNISGVHLEGPWLNPLQCGAQNVAYMKEPNVTELKRLKREYSFIKKVSVAPELRGGLALGKEGRSLGIMMSVAHTDADFDTVCSAYENGYTGITHLYSGMNGVTRKNAYRTAGAVEAGLFLDELYTEVIADGKHLPLSLLRFIYKCKGADKICLITDAIRAAGMENGTQTFIGSLKNGLPVMIEDDIVKTLDRRSFAGSTATTDRLYKTMAKAIGFDPVSLSKVTALTPSRAVGFTDRGEIREGKRADLLLLNEKFEIQKIIFGGRVI